MSTPRTSVGRYQLRGRLGSGGMGTVWHAWDPALQRDVAVKEIALPGGMDPGDLDETRERALREARATARIRDDAVVTVHDVLECDGDVWIVMELLSGRSLRQHLDRDGPLPAARVEETARALLGGLRAAHAAGVTHRDVKPANIMATDDGRTVLTDFGIANLDGSTTLTRDGVYIGSPEYMAPERFEGERALPASDLWSLGVTLYALLEGRSPFKRESITGVISAVLTEPMPPRRAAPGGTDGAASAPLRTLIEALLTRDADARPSAAQALELLDRAQKERDGSPAAAGTAADPPAPAEPARDHAPYGAHPVPRPRTPGTPGGPPPHPVPPSGTGPRAAVPVPPIRPIGPVGPSGPRARADMTTAARGFIRGVGHTHTFRPAPSRVPAPPPPVAAACAMLGLNAPFLLALALLSVNGPVPGTAFAGWGTPVLLALWGGASAAAVAGLLLRSRAAYGLAVLLQAAASAALALTAPAVFSHARGDLVFHLVLLLFNILIGVLLLAPPSARAHYRPKRPGGLTSG